MEPQLTAKSKALWPAAAKLPRFRRLERNVEADVCIVGGGIAGLTTAYLLGKQGKSVVVLDDGALASGMTRVTTAHLSNAIDDRFVEIERWHGEDGARLAAESHGAAIDLHRRDRQELERRLRFPARRRLPVLRTGRRPRKSSTKSSPRRTAPACRTRKWSPSLPLRVRHRPVHSLSAIRPAFIRSSIWPRWPRRSKSRAARSTATATPTASKAATSPRSKSASYTVTADAVVVATNTPINDLVAIHTKQAPYMTYVIGAACPEGLGDRRPLLGHAQGLSLRPAAGTRAAKRRHGSRVRPADRRRRGPQDGQADDADERHARLEAWARDRFPMIDEVEFKWGGQCMETIDGLAFIGRNPLDKENVFVVTGDSGMGITHGTIAGMLLTDLILGRENPWAELYDPSRKTLARRGQLSSKRT